MVKKYIIFKQNFVSLSKINSEFCIIIEFKLAKNCQIMIPENS